MLVDLVKIGCVTLVGATAVKVEQESSTTCTIISTTIQNHAEQPTPNEVMVENAGILWGQICKMSKIFTK